ncbi:MAG: peptidoglycan DD-metalloendopeptidase family protein [Parcubacteria group bacterium]|nr:peptidoglycan DD-metalloendopeptidase family protein [Parcubacteria group bacterium]
MRRESNNVVLAKKTAIQLLSVASSVVGLILKIVAAIFLLVRWIVTGLFRVGIRMLGLPLYRLTKSAMLKMRRVHQWAQEELGTTLPRNIVLYGGLSALLLFATATNIKARELRPEEVGRSSALYALLAANSDFDIIEDTAAVDVPASGSALHAQNRALSEVGVERTVETIGGDAGFAGTSQLAPAGDAFIKPELTGTDVTPQPRGSIITYAVQEGDTISQIAEQFNVSTNTILWENKIGPRDFIKPGQELVILPVSGVTHTVARGDTLNAIATRYRAKPEDVLEINKLSDASELAVGAKIVIPDGIPPPPPAPAVPARTGLANLSDIFKPAPATPGRFNWPTTARRITQYFRGWRHTGIDVGNKTGQPIYAADDGVVVTSGWNNGGYGYYIIIDHGNGIQTLYAHNSKNQVSVGDRVSKGDVIAAIGSTGRSTGPHVHFEVRASGNRVNPLDYL